MGGNNFFLATREWFLTLGCLIVLPTFTDSCVPKGALECEF
jgi:hypothetical protein